MGELKVEELADAQAGPPQHRDPDAGEAVLLKHRYSAFDHTALDIFLGSNQIERVILVGAATEGCVVQTAIDAREHGLKASIVVNACVTTDPELEDISLRYAALVGGVYLERITPDGRRERCDVDG